MMCKVKTTILLLLIFYEALLVYRYSVITENETIYNAVIDIHQFVSSIVFFLICYFYTKKAAHYIPESEKILKIMRVLMYCMLGIVIIFMIWQFSIATNGNGVSTCKNPAFLSAAFFNMLANGFFIYIGYRVYHSVL